MNGIDQRKYHPGQHLRIILIAFTTIATIIISIYCLSSGWFIVFQNLFYIPIILSCIYYTTRGFIYSVFLAALYILLVLIFTSESSIIAQALVRVGLFIAVAGIVTFLSMRRKRAELGLRESEAKYRPIFENAIEGIFQTTPEGRFISANPAQAKLLGYKSPLELIKEVTDVGRQHYVNPEDRQTYKNTLDTEGAIKGFEAQLIKKDGTPVWVSISARTVKNDEGAVIYQGTAMDITDRKRLEEALENDQIHLMNDQIRLTAVLDSIDALVYVADFNSYEVLFLNKYGRKEWGDIAGKRCWETLQEGREGPCEFCTNDRLLSGAGTPTGVYRWEFQNTKNGRWYDCRDQAIRWIDGRLVRLEIATDITGSKLLGEKLRDSEEKFKAIFDNASDGILLADPVTKKFLQGNTAICSMLGYTKEEIEGLTVYDIHPPEDITHVLDEFEKQAEGKKVLAEALPVLRKDGSIFYADVGSNPITIGGMHYLMGIFHDITDRRQAEENMKERESLLKEAQHLAHTGHWELDPSIGTPTWSEEVFHIFGLDPVQGEPSLEDYRKIVHPDDWDILNNAITRSGIEGTPFDIEFRIVRPDKSIGWMNTKGFVTRDNEGNIVRLFGTVQDITERKLAEILIQESEERYRMAIELSNDGVALVQGGDHIYVNQKFLDIFGYERPEDIIGKSPFITVHPDDRQMVMERNLKRHRGEPTSSRYEFKGIRKDGTTLFIEVSVANITYNGESVSLAYLRDVTNRKRAEEMLLGEKNKFLTLSESAPFGVVMIDIKRNFTYINPKFKEMFGYDMEDIPDGRAWFQKAYPDPEYRKTVISAWVEDLKRAKVGQKRPRIFKVSCKDGTEKIVNFIPVQLETGEQMMSCDDITEQKRLEQQLHTMSLTDELTGLYNRRGFITLSGQQLKIAERTKKDMLLFFADLDRMKHINDTLGHRAGDMALVETAAVLKEVFRESDIIGRMGGDEFAILAIDTTDEAREVLIDRLQNTLDNYNKPEGRNYQLSLSTGIAHYDPEAPSTLDELMTQADTLMYEEKRNKKY